MGRDLLSAPSQPGLELGPELGTLASQSSAPPLPPAVPLLGTSPSLVILTLGLL